MTRHKKQTLRSLAACTALLAASLTLTACSELYDYVYASMERLQGETERVGVDTVGADTEIDTVGADTEYGIIGMTVLQSPSVCYLGDTIDSGDVTVKLKLENGDEHTVSDGLSFSPDVFTEIGEQAVTVTYGDSAAVFYVTVRDAAVKKVELSQLPLKLAYNVGDAPDTEGLSLNVTYENGEIRTVTSGFTCSPAVFSSTGSQKVTVTYGGRSDSFNVNVKNVSLTSVTVERMPTKTDYNVGDRLSTEGLVLMAYYSNGRAEIIESGYACTPTVLDEAGMQTVSVTYGTAATTFSVNVQTTTRSLTDISVYAKPTQLSYTEGDTLNTSGLTLLVRYSDGSTQTVRSGFTCSPTLLKLAGTQLITVSYGGRTATFGVTVQAKPQSVVLSSVDVISAPKKVSYYVGEAPDVSGLALTLNYSDGTKTEAVGGFTCTPATLTRAGETVVSVMYEGTVVFSFRVSVAEKPKTVVSLSIARMPLKTEYIVGETLDTSELVLDVGYSDGTLTKVTDGYTCSPTMLRSEGKQDITVTYGGKTVTFTVNVKGEHGELKQLKLSSDPNKTDYIIGDKVELDGLKLTAVYEDGTTEKISSGFTCSTTVIESGEESQVLIIEYGGKTVSVRIRVKTITDISVANRPTKTVYTVGETLELTGMKINVKYSDGSTARVSEGFTCSPTVLTTPGDVIITVTYRGASSGFHITVNE